ncbi:reverse transcriptase domain-containing protein [Tenacibaculum sp. M341]|uniref:reverse transcriptase domain-containing protein n=1 Tax=Tenacibaculum sp. M341 TaxID=2530339 RepID=UPI001FB42490|nr:reverse transcriptase domain-containing protein [Tenacibaculum sp. M341]
MIASVLHPHNLSIALKRVITNGGVSGIDGMNVSDLKRYSIKYRTDLVNSIYTQKYRCSAIKGINIPKARGKTRLLGVPTVIDRWLQQAVNQQLSLHFEINFEGESYGFRPKKNLQQAVLKSQSYINEGFQDIVDIDLKSFFDEVPHYKVLQLIYNKISCDTTLWLIRKWIQAAIVINDRLYKRRKGLPQGSPLSPLLSNILLDQLDKCLKNKGYNFVRYADDFSIYTKSKSLARKIGNEVYVFLRDHLDLPINKSKSGIRRPINFTILGYGFTAIYKKGK